MISSFASTTMLMRETFSMQVSLTVRLEMLKPLCANSRVILAKTPGLLSTNKTITFFFIANPYFTIILSTLPPAGIIGKTLSSLSITHSIQVGTVFSFKASFKASLNSCKLLQEKALA